MTPALFQTARGRESAPLTLPGPPPRLEVVKPEYTRSVLRAWAGGGRGVRTPWQAYDRPGDRGPDSPTGTCPLVSAPAMTSRAKYQDSKIGKEAVYLPC